MVAVVERLVQVSVKNGGRIVDEPVRWVMLEAESEALAFEVPLFWPDSMRVAIAFHDAKRSPKVLEWNQNVWTSDVSKMPDLIGGFYAV